MMCEQHLPQSDTPHEDDQQHCWCQCENPLLRSVGEGPTTWFFIYRAVPAGPQSASLLLCPQCGVTLDIGSVHESVKP